MKICPYVGLSQDPQTPAIFPSDRNFCHRVKPALAVLDAHQQAHCLVEEHQSCPIFVDKNSDARREFLYRPASPGKRENYFSLLLGFFGLAGALLLIWYYLTGFSPTSGAAQSVINLPAQPAPGLSQKTPVVSESNGPLASLLETPSPLPASSSTALPPTETASVTPPPDLETPIGPQEHQFLIHRVVKGESLTSLAARYGTTPNAIQAINYVMPLPLWENWLVVILYEASDVANLPLFEPYQIGQESTRVDELAKTLDADLDLLMHYNNLVASDILSSGRWILVPRNRP